MIMKYVVEDGKNYLQIKDNSLTSPLKYNNLMFVPPIFLSKIFLTFSDINKYTFLYIFRTYSKDFDDSCHTQWWLMVS